MVVSGGAIEDVDELDEKLSFATAPDVGEISGLLEPVSAAVWVNWYPRTGSLTAGVLCCADDIGIPFGGA